MKPIQNEGKIYESLACAEILSKASNGMHWLRWIVTYPVNKVIRFRTSGAWFCRYLSTFVSCVQNVSKPGGPGVTRHGPVHLTAHHGAVELIVFIGAGISSLLILITLIVYAVIRYVRWNSTSESNSTLLKRQY